MHGGESLFFFSYFASFCFKTNKHTHTTHKMCIFSNHTHNINILDEMLLKMEFVPSSRRCCALKWPSIIAAHQMVASRACWKLLKLLAVVISHKCHLECLKNHIIKPLKRITIMAGNLYKFALNNFMVSCCSQTRAHFDPRIFSTVPKSTAMHINQMGCENSVLAAVFTFKMTFNEALMTKTINATPLTAGLDESTYSPLHRSTYSHFKLQ